MGLMLGIGALLVAEGVLVTAVLVSPSARVTVSAKLAGVTEVLAGSDDAPGLTSRVSGGASNFYRTWAQPLWSAPALPKAGSGFSKCVSCHKDYASPERAPMVRMDHPRHAQAGVDCATCHTSVDHPDPGIPEEKVCAGCHDETKSIKSCGFCHAPGSLPHFYLLGIPRDGAVDCATCHRPGEIAKGSGRSRLNAPAFTGKNRALCSKCHEKAVCEKCHSEKHPANWLANHGDGDSAPCLRCHRYEWCTERCHNRPAFPRSISSARFSGGSQ